MDFRGQRREVPPSSRPGERLLGFRRITAHEQYPRHPECGRRVPPFVLIPPNRPTNSPTPPAGAAPSHVSHQNSCCGYPATPTAAPDRLGNQEPRLTIHHTTSLARRHPAAARLPA